MPRKLTGQQSNNSTQSTENMGKKSNEDGFDIITTSSWDINKHVCGAAKLNKSGQGKSATLTYNGRKFYLRTPKMYCPFGASKPKPKPGEKAQENAQWSVQFVFGDDKESQEFYNKVSDFDQFMIDEGLKLENNVGWLGGSRTKPYSREVVESKYSTMIKYSKKDGEAQKQYPPFIRASLPTLYNEPSEFNCELYDQYNNLLDVSPSITAPNSVTGVISPGCWCTALIIGSIWCNPSGFGVSWRIAQIKIYPSKGSLPKGKCMIDDPKIDDEEEKEEGEKENNDHDEDEIDDMKDNEPDFNVAF